jgi:hypothetical protein
MRGALAWSLRLLLGAALCLTPVTAVLALGWTYRLMQRCSESRWHHWAGDAAAETPPRSPLGAAAAGAWQTVRLGALGLAGSLLLTAPAGGLWILAWWAGWNNSFNKGYEQAWVGPIVGLLGIAFWVAAMMVVPLAEARFAATGRIASLFELRLAARLWRQRPWAAAALALGFAAAAALLLALRFAPLPLQASIPDFDTMPAERFGALALAFSYAVALIGFAAFVGLHLWSARLYAGALALAVRSGEIAPDRLYRRERVGVQKLAPATRPPAPKRRWLRRLNRALAALIAAGAWLAVAVLLFAAQFWNHAWPLWLLHPMVLLPWVA